jgi:hypothetical protein
MNYRINSKAVILVVLLVVVAVALFAYTLVSAPTAVPEEGGALDNSLPADAQLITGQYQYRGGIHTIAGTVDLPSPCHNLR